MRALSLYLMLLLVMVNCHAGDTAGLLVYKVWEPGVEPYFSRILVTPDHVRFDEGTDKGEFTLFKRSEVVIYNISRESESVFVMRAHAPAQSGGTELQLSEQRSSDAEAPKVAGKQPQRLQLFTNGEPCRELVVIPDTMTATLNGLAQFQRSLAVLQLATLGDEPVSGCEKSEILYASDRWLKYGLPLQDSFMGKRQLLVDFREDYPVTPDLFVVPAAYREITMPGFSAE